MSKDGSGAIYLASEEPARGKFIVSSAFTARHGATPRSPSLTLPFSYRFADGQWEGERGEVAFP